MRTYAPRLGRVLLAMSSCLILAGTLIAQTAHVESTSNQKVSIDPKSRKVVPPNPEDMQSLTTKERSAAVPNVQVRQLPNGARAAQLPEEFMDATVVTLNEDGSLNMECVRGMDAANKLVENNGQSKVQKPSTQAAKQEAKPERKE
jgi:microcompartment protein CcmL/EutN